MAACGGVGLVWLGLGPGGDLEVRQLGFWWCRAAEAAGGLHVGRGGGEQSHRVAGGLLPLGAWVEEGGRGRAGSARVCCTCVFQLV